MFQNFPVVVTLFAHDGGSDLAKTNSMSPSGSCQMEPFGYTVLYRSPVNDKSGTEQVTFREDASDFQFLADNHCLVGSDNFQFTDASGLSPFNRYQIDDLTIITSGVPVDQSGKFFLSVMFFPPIEVCCFVVVIVQDQ